MEGEQPSQQSSSISKRQPPDGSDRSETLPTSCWNRLASRKHESCYRQVILLEVTNHTDDRAFPIEVSLYAAICFPFPRIPFSRSN
ncbi:hypothetical protein RRG08_014546 [Elysia crispata]|uniref:Uncharacterized protein n=1 Tax=Elysia crispata TaxID=231223 RepID=A0AAE0Y013_9GAST|nr:hypothetical protein RRG08_014546 [Elysia crispata]